MASLLAEFIVDPGGTSYDADFRNAKINPSSLSGGRSYRRGGGGESGKELQGRPQEKQEEERSAAGKDLRPGDISSVPLFLRLAFYPDIELNLCGKGQSQITTAEVVGKIEETLPKLDNICHGGVSQICFLRPTSALNPRKLV